MIGLGMEVLRWCFAMVGKWRTRRGSFRAYKGKTQHYDRSMVKTKPGAQDKRDEDEYDLDEDDMTLGRYDG